MQDFKSFSEHIKDLKPEDFETLALELFRFQSSENQIYKKYIEARQIDISQVSHLKDIPFLPIRFFKDFKVISGDESMYPGFYSSSGTTGMVTSKHYYWSENWYLNHAQNIFEREYGPIDEFHILALLPSYLERKGSSLVSMADHFIKVSKSPDSGFYLYNQNELIEKLQFLSTGGKNILLLGVTFALLDLAESGIDLPEIKNLIVMETGGMKGRRKEMVREQVHANLKSFFRVDSIHSEYGMTELFSQAYSKGNGKYTLPPTMRVMLRDINDPLSWTTRKQGGINVIDLANFHSCAFIETQDLGSFDKNGKLEILGRFDNSEIRGCNLLVQ